jgi:hypothetical protein
MKKYNFIFVIILIFGVAGVFLSCDDLINEKQYTIITEVEDSNEGADQLVIGTYSYLLNDMFRWDQFPKVLDIDCDYMTGPDWSLSKIGAGNFQGDDAMDPVWTKSFTLIHRANNAIENIELMTNITEEHKLNTIGEMKFLKAWAYFLLVRAYGDVPVFYESVNKGADYNQPRKPITEVYGHIIDLLKEAEAGMYKNTNSAFKPGRASAGAAASLLAKVYVTIASASLPSGSIVTVRGGVPVSGTGDNKQFTTPIPQNFIKNQVAGYENFNSQEYFELAREKAKQVIDGEYGAYDLLPSDQLWTIPARHKVEHIWMIQPISGDDLYGAGIAAYYTGTEDGNGMIIEGLFYGCRDHWYKLFEAEDLRIVEGVIHRWINRDYHESWNGGGFYPNNDEWSIKARGYIIQGSDTLYNDPITGLAYEKQPPFTDGRSYTNDNSDQYIARLMKYYYATDRSKKKSDVPWPVLRFADVLLIYAEAANEAANGPTQAAVDALNRVRQRSKASMRPLSNFTGKEDFRSFVIEERARELALEGDRRWDLIRWGIYLDAMNSIGGNDEVGIRKVRENKHLLFPIPSAELDANKAISGHDNPGW